MHNTELDHKIITAAESVYSEIMYDIEVNINFSDFASTVMKNNSEHTKKLCDAIYKYYNS
jgi:hypothetical protein